MESIENSSNPYESSSVDDRTIGSKKSLILTTAIPTLLGCIVGGALPAFLVFADLLLRAESFDNSWRDIRENYGKDLVFAMVMFSYVTGLSVFLSTHPKTGFHLVRSVGIVALATLCGVVACFGIYPDQRSYAASERFPINLQTIAIIAFPSLIFTFVAFLRKDTNGGKVQFGESAKGK